MKKIKTLIVTMVLIIAMASPAKAVIPLVYFGYSLAIHVGVVAGLIWWNTKRSGNSSANTTTGNVVTPGETIWVDLTGEQPVVHNDNVKLRIDHDDIKSIINANPTKYAQLKQAMEQSDTYASTERIPVGQTAQQQAGKKVNINGTIYLLGNCVWSSEETTNPTNGNDYYSVTWEEYGSDKIRYTLWNAYANAPGEYKQYLFQKQGTASEGTREATPEEFANKINAQPAVYQGNIDDAIKSNPNVVHFDNSTSNGGNSGTGTYSTPIAPTEQQIANHGGTSQISPGTAIQQQISTATQGTSSGYLPSVKPNYDTNFGDAPTKKDIKTLIGDFLATSPLFQVLENTKINLSGETSTISMPTYKGAYKTIDFSKYETQLDMAGTIMLSLIHILAIIILFAK